MIKRKIRSMIDQTLDTTIESRLLVKGEVVIMKFKNQEQFEDLIRFGIIQEASIYEPVRKEIPVLLPNVILTDESLKEREKV